MTLTRARRKPGGVVPKRIASNRHAGELHPPAHTYQNRVRLRAHTDAIRPQGERSRTAPTRAAFR